MNSEEWVLDELGVGPFARFLAIMRLDMAIDCEEEIVRSVCV